MFTRIIMPAVRCSTIKMSRQKWRVCRPLSLYFIITLHRTKVLPTLSPMHCRVPALILLQRRSATITYLAGMMAVYYALTAMTTFDVMFLYGGPLLALTTWHEPFYRCAGLFRGEKAAPEWRAFEAVATNQDQFQHFEFIISSIHLSSASKKAFIKSKTWVKTTEALQ